MKMYDDITETNRNILTDDEDVKLIKSLIGHRCLVKGNRYSQNYDSITITGYSDGIIRYNESANSTPKYMNRCDFFPIVMRMPEFDNEKLDTPDRVGCQTIY